MYHCHEVDLHADGGSINIEGTTSNEVVTAKCARFSDFDSNARDFPASAYIRHSSMRCVANSRKRLDLYFKDLSARPKCSLLFRPVILQFEISGPRFTGLCLYCNLRSWDDDHTVDSIR